MSDSTYQTKVYRSQGGDTLTVASGGNIVMDSGGYFSAAGDFYLESGCNMILASGATLTLNSGAMLSMNLSTVETILSGGALNFNSGATLSLGNSALANMYSNANWAVLSNATMAFHSGAVLSLGNSAAMSFDSDARLDMASGFNFYFPNISALPATYLGNFLIGRLNHWSVSPSAGAGSGVFSVVSLPSNVGYIIFKGLSACSNASAQLWSGKIGEQVTLRLGGLPTATPSASVRLYPSGGGISGVSLIGYKGTALSSITLDGSGNLGPYVTLLCVADSTWAVMSRDAINCYENTLV